MDILGQTISHFRIIERLGAGGMGVVYKAADLKLDRFVALKFLPPHLYAEEKARARFITEARAASALEHPNIGTIYEIDEAPERGLFIAMAYYAGETLATQLGRGPLLAGDAVEVAVQVAEGLAVAHERGIIHRDIKPNNLMVTEGGLVKILDFGLAKIQDRELTDAGIALGTPSYMSPEQTSGAAVDHRADVWALGVVLFNMLAGYLPFRGDAVPDLLHAIREEEPAPLPAPPELRSVVLKALAKRPADRHPTMRAFAKELRRVQRTLTALPSTPAAAASTSEAATIAPIGAVTEASPPPRAPASGELRQVTVVSCELADFAALAERLDAQQLREVLVAFQKVCEDTMRRFDGYPDHFRDAEVRICFGYPVAHEDDALRAVSAALEIVGAITALRAELRRAVPEIGPAGAQVRAGVHTGQVIAGDTGSGGRYGLVGMAGAHATKAQELAEPGQVVVTDQTCRLVRGFVDARPLGVRRLAGVSTPVQLHEIRGRTPAESRIDAAAGAGLTELVSRTRELEFLLECWAEVQEGSGQIVLLSGDAGVGKSRLVHELSRKLGESRYSRWICRCSPYHQNSPLWPVAALVGRMLAVPAAADAAEQFEVMRTALARRGLTAPEEIHVMASLLTVPVPAGAPPSTLPASRARERTLAALLKLIRAVADDEPVVFVVEDLHWVDPTTLEFLGLLVDQGPTARIFTVLTCRPEFGSPWGSRSHVHHLTLGRLTRRESERMINHLARDKRLPPELVSRLVSTADGIPLFLEEVTKAVLESDALQETTDAYELKSPDAVVPIPPTLADSLMARLDRLGDAKEVAQLAAVFGRTLSYDWLRAVCPLGEATLRADLTRLVDAEILYQQGLPPEASYSFKHALIRDAAYYSLPARARQLCHQRIVETFEARFAEMQERQPELLAHHCTEAGLLDQAAAYWRRAGQHALQRSANAEASAHFQRALEVLGSVPETDARRQERLELSIALGGSRTALLGYAAPAVGEAYRQARELCGQVEDTSQLFDALQGLWAFHVVRAELQIGLDLANRLVELAGRLGDHPRALEASLRRGISLYTLGRLEEARRHMEQVLTDEDADVPREVALLFGQDRAVACLAHLSWVLWLLGQSRRAVAVSEQALARGREIAHPFSLAFARLYAAMLHALRRDPAAVREQAEALAGICQEHAFGYRLAQSHILQGWAAAVGERDELAVGRITAAIEKTRATGAEVLRPFYLLLLADACLCVGRPSQGLQASDEALDAIERTSEHLFEAELHRLRGELLAAAGAAGADAEACFSNALEISRAQGARALELRAAISLARLRRDDPDAQEHLRAALQAVDLENGCAERDLAARLLPRQG